MNAPLPPLTQCPQCRRWDRTTHCKWCDVSKMKLATYLAFILGAYCAAGWVDLHEEQRLEVTSTITSVADEGAQELQNITRLAALPMVEECR